jgi:hypothetical protein
MSRLTQHIETATSLVVGVLSVVWLQVAYGWWLNSGIGVVRTSTVLFVLGFLIAAWRSGSPRRRSFGLWLGAIAAMTAVLFKTGPGNIWPIVLVVASGLSAVAVFSGSWIGRRVRARS